MIVKYIRRALRKFNYELLKYPYGDHAKRMEIIKQFDIQIILDVGANIGEFATTMREIGYKDKIVSFEPRKHAFSELLHKAESDSNWRCLNIALGDIDCTSIINISGNSPSSSILEMNQIHIESRPISKYIGKEEIVVKRLDSVISELIEKDKDIYLKIDTQGFEKQVLEGAKGAFQNIRAIQLEMSLVELYRGSMLIYNMIPYMENKGFFLSSLERGFYDPKSKRLLQVDGIFIRLD